MVGSRAADFFIIGISDKARRDAIIDKACGSAILKRSRRKDLGISSIESFRLRFSVLRLKDR